MAKAQISTTETTVCDTKSGRIVTVRGVGALKGHLTIQKGLDLTKPIASQALKGAKRHKATTAQPKI